MSRFRLSRSAETDLRNIAAYTLERWGTAQADYYLAELASCCQTLADNPKLGRLCSRVRPGLRRLEHGKHVVSYRESADGVAVSRVLHQRMLPEIHNLDD